MRVALAWLLVVPVVVWTVVRIAGLERGFPLLPLMAFTPFAAGAAVAVAVVVSLLRARVAAAVALICAVLLVAGVAPRALGGGSDAEGPTLRVLTANVYRGDADLDALLELVRRERVDVLSLQEIDADFAARLEDEPLLPHSVVRLRGQWDGTALYARRPLQALPVPEGFVNAIAVARMGALELWAVHPPAPVNDLNVGRLTDELGRLPSAGKGPPRVLAGDFNATFDHAAFRDVVGRGYTDAAKAVGAGLVPTWPERRRFPPRVTIDHVLVDDRLEVRGASVHRIPGSDHRAVLAEVTLPG